MTSGQKIALSILISMFLSVGFILVGNLGLFSKLETRYYSKMKITEQKEHIDKIADGYNSNISNFLKKIDGGDQSYLKSTSINSFFEQNPSESAVNERKKLTEKLFSEFSYLSGIRVIDRNSRNIHYSSFDKTDVLRQVGISKIYKNYPDIIKETNELSAELIMSDAINPANKIFLDENRNRIIISVPYFTEDDILISSFVFYLDISLLNQELLSSENLMSGENPVMLKINDEISGFVIGLPQDRRNEFTKPIENVWSEISSDIANNTSMSLSEPREILQADNFSYVMISSVSCPYFYFSGIYKNTLFKLSKDIVVMIYVCFSLTCFLIVFLIFSLKRNYLLTMKSRIKKIQYGIIDEYLENKENIEWGKIARQINNRKKDLTDEIKKSIGGRSKKYSKEIDEFLEQSWADIISVISTHYSKNYNKPQSSLTIEEIRSVIEDVLKNTNLNVNVSPSAVVQPVDIAKTNVNTITTKEEIGDVEEVEEVEAIDDVEPVEAIDDAEPVEEIGDVEPVEDVDEVEEIEEVEEAEPVEEIEEVEPVDEVEEAEPVDEVEAIDEAEVIDDVEEVEPPKDAALLAFISPRASERHVAKDAKTYSQNIDGEDDFASVEDYQSEELCFGDIYTLQTENDSIILAQHKNEKVPEVISTSEEKTHSPETIIETESKEDISSVDNSQKQEDLSAVEELIPISDEHFSMTNFGMNMKDIVELEEDDIKSIVQKDGLFSIAEDIKYSNFNVDSNF